MTKTELLQVSVVMTLIDKPMAVLQTIQSVLDQQGVELELIVVADQVATGIQTILRVYNKDKRVRVIKQGRKQTAWALVRGCKHASYEYIARIDAGDTMVPGRLHCQASELAKDSSLGVVFGWAEVTTSEGYRLYQFEQSEETVLAGVQARHYEDFSLPIHATAMFRKSIYREAGGYRPEFHILQDGDLWSRMLEVAKLKVIPKKLISTPFQSKLVDPAYLSDRKEVGRLIIKSRSLRAANKSEKALLRRASKIRPHDTDWLHRAKIQISVDRHLAKLLSQSKSPHASEYWWRVIREEPMNFEAWWNALRGLSYR